MLDGLWVLKIVFVKFRIRGWPSSLVDEAIKRNHGKMAFGYNSTLVASGKVAKRTLEKALLSRM
jgi:hypothetical protein